MSRRTWPPASLDTTEATAEQSAGLVTITSDIEFGAGEAAGSGIVIGSDGLVVTNHHVVEGATSIRVTVVTTGRTYDAEVLGTNAKRDVAVLQLEDAVRSRDGLHRRQWGCCRGGRDRGRGRRR